MDTTSTWDGLSVEVTHEIHADSREFINRGLTEFNTQHLGDHKWVALDVYVRDLNGQIVGGLIGRGFCLRRATNRYGLLHPSGW
jgi:hypothetical protein